MVIKKAERNIVMRSMRLSIISFTENGKQLSEKIRKKLKHDMEKEDIEKKDLKNENIRLEITLYTKCKVCMNNGAASSVLYVEASIEDWAQKQMQERNVMLFIGACGIAVRAIAHSLTDKLNDAPVLVMDENGKYIIPILSGHMGGANKLAEYIAVKADAIPVITTATDIHKKFAVDLFAKRNGLFIMNKEGIVKISSKVLAGKEITISIESGHESCMTELENMTHVSYFPAGVKLVPYPPEGFVDVVVTSKEKVFDADIMLKPKEYIIGMGCKRGKSVDEIESFIKKKINELDISITQILALASISQKNDEAGMLEWCQKEGILFLTYTAEELQKTEGNFKKSAFVKEQVGVDNVCERAAVKACKTGGKLILEKCAENGMTIAIAKREWKADFYGE